MRAGDWHESADLGPNEKERLACKRTRNLFGVPQHAQIRVGPVVRAANSDNALTSSESIFDRYEIAYRTASRGASRTTVATWNVQQP